MTTHYKLFRNWDLIEWRCCGNLWQLLLSPRFPERNSFRPRCPDCGGTV